MKRNAATGRGELPIYFGVSILLIIVGFLTGLLRAASFSAWLTPVLQKLKQTILATDHTGWIHLFWSIFIHNATSATELAIFGLAFGLFPAYMMWMNGLISGFVVARADVAGGGIPPWETIVYGLLPHGIFELSAIFWAASLGMANGLAVIRAIRLRLTMNDPSVAGADKRDRSARYRDAHPLRFALYRTARSLPIIWGMLVIAAFIESAVTPHIMSWGIPQLHHH
ncbi:stage II sporulation protein M [Alicyclobacillus dauci]|uniref:Stage II sporulation protein M n=1 Tax=Alicyclobacillus dauci TaxID=1475485 RepID=A0ABY6Z3K6_9BACL|nr:stage II sporulation protein M [Alicyclobacillus dauci]WAH37427.1 stage II sporulation protein M [Alicyclobacillus dauci]